MLLETFGVTLVCFGSATRFSCRCPLFRELCLYSELVFCSRLIQVFSSFFAWFYFLLLYRYMHWFSSGSKADAHVFFTSEYGILYQDSICIILFCFLVMMICKL